VSTSELVILFGKNRMDIMIPVTKNIIANIRGRTIQPFCINLDY
jgi:hypothetical protein